MSHVLRFCGGGKVIAVALSVLSAFELEALAAASVVSQSVCLLCQAPGPGWSSRANEAFHASSFGSQDPSALTMIARTSF